MRNKSRNDPLVIVFSNLGIGGIQRKIIDILNYLEDNDIHVPVEIILRKDDPYASNWIVRNKQVHITVYQKRNRFRHPFGFSIFLWIRLLQLQPRCVLSFLSSFSIPVLISKIFIPGLRVVVSQDNHTSCSIRLLRYPILNRIGVRLLYPLADTIITPSKASKTDLVRVFSIAPQRIRVIPNWTTAPKWTERPRPFDVITVGRFVPQKNIPMLLRALTTLIRDGMTTLRALIVGDGPDEATIRMYLNAPRVNKAIRVMAPPNNVLPIYRKAKVFAFTSPPDIEGFPLAVLEAMAGGATVVTTEFGSAHEVIRHRQTGYIVRDETDLAKTIQTLLQKPDVCRATARRAYAYVKDYHAPDVIRGYLQALHLL